MAKSTPTTRYVAFLRGINVGGHRVKMDVLAAQFVALKYENVTTFIASGNVLFEAPALADPAAIERAIEAQLERSLGYEVATFLRTPAELAAVLAYQPFSDEDTNAEGHTIHVGFLREPLDEVTAQSLLGFRTAMDEFAVLGREFSWLCRGKSTDSLVKWPKVAKAVKAESTMRNMTMLRKLAVKLP